MRFRALVRQAETSWITETRRSVTNVHSQSYQLRCLSSGLVGRRSENVDSVWRGRSAIQPGVYLRNWSPTRSYATRGSDLEFESEGSGLRRRPPPNMGIAIVPQQTVYVVERLGKFHHLLGSGIHLLIPFVDSISYAFSLKEEAISIPNQMAITRDNVTIHIDGVLYAKVEDPKAAAYGVENPYRALTLLAQTTMRSELGKLSLDKTFEERDSLNAAIVESINAAAASWGIRCLRYEIRDIAPPANVRKAMELQAEAERRKRANILDSEGEMQSEINLAEGRKTSTILSSEAAKTERINQALGEAEAIRARADATADALRKLSSAIGGPNGHEAVSLRLAEQYLSAFANLAKESNTLIIPAEANNVGRMVAEAVTVFKTVNASNARSSTKSVQDPLADSSQSLPGMSDINRS